MKILFISLGCDKNLVDSEVMLGLLKGNNYEFTDNEEEAEVIVVNTCCFIQDAKEESIQTILEMAEYRKKGLCKALVVAGCMAQRYQKEIKEEIEEVDAIIGTTAIDKIVCVIEDILGNNGEKKDYDQIGDIHALTHVKEKRVITTGGHYAYLKIAEGCDKGCTYCIIPSLRGKYRSVPMERLIEEGTKLAEGGVKELILVAQETTVYGKDIYGKKMLPALLKELCKIKGIVWIRIFYCYPEEITKELIKVIKEEEKICHYLDIPIQHASDNVLKRMGRRTNRKQLEELLENLRKEIPDLCIRTTFMTGFPGEREEDFRELLEFIDKVEFDRLGVFTYSQEEGTLAASMDGQLTEEIKEERKAKIMELQQEISLEKGEEMIGKELYAFVEGKVVDENAYIARTYKDAPNVDGYLFIHSEEELITGDFVKVKITGALEYDLIGEAIG